MKEKNLSIIGLVAILTLFVFNVKFAISGDIKSKLERPFEGSSSGLQVCVTDDCSVSVGLPPIVYTYYGHYAHCVEGPGWCWFLDCYHPCDAM